MEDQHVKLREFIETVIELNNLRRDDQLAAEKERLREKFESLAEALKLQASAFPKVQDFNDLKTRVDVGFAGLSGSSNAMTTLFQVLTVASVLGTMILGYLVYAAK